MCGVRTAALGEHLLGVAVVGRDHARAAGGMNVGHDPAEALVGHLHRLDRRLQHARVPDHVGVGEVDHRQLRLLLGERGFKRPNDLAARTAGLRS